MKLRSFKTRLLILLLLIFLAATGVLWKVIDRVQERQVDQATYGRVVQVQAALEQALGQEADALRFGLQLASSDPMVVAALQRTDIQALQSLANEWGQRLGGRQLTFEYPVGPLPGHWVRVDAAGANPMERSETLDGIGAGVTSLHVSSTVGRPSSVYATLTASLDGAAIGAVSLGFDLSPWLDSAGETHGMRLFALAPAAGVVARSAPQTPSTWELVAAGEDWNGPAPAKLLEEVLAQPDPPIPLRLELAGRPLRALAFDLGIKGAVPLCKLLALVDVTPLEVAGRPVLLWSGLVILALAGMTGSLILIGLRPVEHRLTIAHRMLMDSNSQLEDEVERRTQEMTTVNSRLQHEVDVRQQAEQKLLRQQMFLLTVLDSLAYPFIVVDAHDFGIKLANKSALPGAEQTGGVLNCHGLIYGRKHPCQGRDMPCVLQEMFRTRMPVTVEHRHTLPDGRIQINEVHAYPVMDGQGEIEQIIEYFFDVSERKRAEEALNASELNYRQLVEAANSIVLRWDTQGVIQFINGYGARFLGFEGRELVGRALIGTIVPEVDSSGRNMVELMQDIIRRPDSYQNNENENMRSDGSRVWVAWANKAILGQKGQVVEILSFGNDISRRRRAIEALGESEIRFRRIYENSPVMMHSLDESGCIIGVNRKWTEETGYTKAEVMGRALISFMTPESAQRAASEVLPALRRQDYLKEVSFQLARKDGTVIDILMDCSLSTDPKGSSISLGVLQNVSERRRTEQEMQLAASVFENSIEGILVTDPQGTILRTNKAFTLMTGYTPQEALGRNPSFLRSGKHDAQFFADMWSAIKETGLWQGEIWNRRKNGEVYPEWLGVSTVYDERRQPIYYVGVFTDITDQKLSEQRIYHLAHYDVLTDLPNRVLFQDRLDRALLSAKRGEYPLLLLYLDLDRFKPINDSFGHPVGDLLLQQVAERLRQCVRESDTVARMGGDEFTVILGPGHSPGVDVVQIGSRVARTILENLGNPFDLEGHEVFISASIGIVVYPNDGGNVAELVRNADTAMYHAKAKGRNNFLFYEAHMNATAADRLMIENSLRRALERSEFELYFQPSVNIREGRIDALEALIRWCHPDLGVVAPEQFISLAEESGLIVPIGEWVLREAVRQVAQWRQAGFGHLRVAVNLSLRQFRHRDLMNVIRQVMFEAGLDASVLALEVTESAFMEDEEETIARLNEMSEMGIQILIDDFGTGYSSLARLRTLPIQVLKIDRSFIRDITTDPNDASIIAAIIAMAHNLQLKVIAEGVETPSQLKFLKSRDCEEVQGYLFSRPVPGADVLELLRRGVSLPE